MSRTILLQINYKLYIQKKKEKLNQMMKSFDFVILGN
jgi:hypothetical protein